MYCETNERFNVRITDGERILIHTGVILKKNNYFLQRSSKPVESTVLVDLVLRSSRRLRSR